MAMRHPERLTLLHGPYSAPGLKRGDRATCLYRDSDVIITGWSDWRIPWPRCRIPGTHGGGSGLLVDEELARAIRNESSAAIQYWFGVHGKVVWSWRRALGVGRFNEGSAKLRAETNAEVSAKYVKGKALPPEQVERRRQTALEQNLAKHLKHGYHGPLWTREQLALVGTLPDAEVARRIGRSTTAVRVKRQRLSIPSAFDRRRRGARVG